MKILKYCAPKKILVTSLGLFLLSFAIIPTLQLFDRCQSKVIWNTCDIWELGVIRPFSILMLALFFAVLLFVFKVLKTYLTWIRVTFFWLVFTLGLMLLTPTIPQSGPMMDLFPDPARDEVVLFLAIPYVIVSWLIALWGFLKSEKK